MPCRKIILASGEIYHIFNRGVARNPIFSSTQDNKRFLELINYYRFRDTPMSFSWFKKLPNDDKKRVLEILASNRQNVEIISFCLMPNHFHLLVKQTDAEGITKFMQNLQNGYVKYFNIKHNRVGPLFQSIFKAVRIETDEQLAHVSRYIHLNPSTGHLVKIEDLPSYLWSSLPDYLGEKRYDFIETKQVLDIVSPKYQDFLFEQAEYQRTLDKIKHLTFE